MKKMSKFIIFLYFMIIFLIRELTSLNSTGLCILPRKCLDLASNKRNGCDLKCKEPYAFKCGIYSCSLNKETCSEFHSLSFFFRIKNIQISDIRINSFENLLTQIKKCEEKYYLIKKYIVLLLIFIWF